MLAGPGSPAAWNARGLEEGKHGPLGPGIHSRTMYSVGVVRVMIGTQRRGKHIARIGQMQTKLGRKCDLDHCHKCKSN